MTDARMAEAGMTDAGIAKVGILDCQQKRVMLFFSQLTFRRGRRPRHPRDQKLGGNWRSFSDGLKGVSRGRVAVILDLPLNISDLSFGDIPYGGVAGAGVDDGVIFNAGMPDTGGDDIGVGIVEQLFQIRVVNNLSTQHSGITQLYGYRVLAH